MTENQQRIWSKLFLIWLFHRSDSINQKAKVWMFEFLLAFLSISCSSMLLEKYDRKTGEPLDIHLMPLWVDHTTWLRNMTHEHDSRTWLRNMNHQALVFLSENIESFHSYTNLCNLLFQSIIDQYQFDVIDRAAKDLVNAIDTCGPLCETSRQKYSTLPSSFANINVNFYNLLRYNTLSYFKNPKNS